jgi:hypothetical protein
VTNLTLGHRGTALFTADRLDAIVRETVTPELDATHAIVVVGAVTSEGVKAALVFHRQTPIGDWRLEAAFLHNFESGENQAGARVILKF